MQINLIRPGKSLSLPVLTLMVLLCYNTRAAEWGSIWANNRSSHEIRGPQQGVVTRKRGREENRSIQADVSREHERRPVVRSEGRDEEARRWTEQAREHRHLDVDEDRRQGYFWSGIAAGSLFSGLPPGYVQLYANGNPYYYYDGAYYQSAPAGYVAVNPPIGAMVPTPPQGAEPVPVGPTVYYYANGAFYAPVEGGFTVTTPPPGVTVSSLPPGATPVYIRGGLYYQANGSYFQPSIRDGVTVYTTVQP